MYPPAAVFQSQPGRQLKTTIAQYIERNFPFQVSDDRRETPVSHVTSK
jgi:hypothetical protein